MFLKSTDACSSSAAGVDKTPVSVGKPPATVAPMISSACHKNESVAKRYGPHSHTDYKAAITTATATTTTTATTATATTTSSNTNRRSGGGGGGGSSRNFTYALAVVSLSVFLLVVCYAIWTLSIETILPVVTESNKNLEDLRPNNLPPLLIPAASGFNVNTIL
ncbi:Hypothetical predicted protein [Octopus vulgaris]|uniref:Uncharacterized protein n=1 Tax=Octopus vulgaris TaxID=6645 RepID=A0AA36B9R0_OCTVU|nr:Hypothetical predicted protein [Octopus vulgaris]